MRSEYTERKLLLGGVFLVSSGTHCPFSDLKTSPFFILYFPYFFFFFTFYFLFISVFSFIFFSFRLLLASSSQFVFPTLLIFLVLYIISTCTTKQIVTRPRRLLLYMYTCVYSKVIVVALNAIGKRSFNPSLCSRRTFHSDEQFGT